MGGRLASRALPLPHPAYIAPVMSSPDRVAFEPFDGELVPARFLRRPNRFVVYAALGDGREVRAHLANPGRLEGILAEGRAMRLQRASDPERKTDWSAVLARTPDGGGWVSLVTTLPNRLVGEALSEEGLEELSGWRLERTEPAVGESRLDFLLSRDGRRLALEVKSVTLERAGVGLFPDAVTARGTRHVDELADVARSRSGEAAVLFVAQRGDVSSVTAAPDIDPAFAAALEEAREAGVETLARRCVVTDRGVALGPPVPVLPPAEAPPASADAGDRGRPAAGAP